MGDKARPPAGALTPETALAAAAKCAGLTPEQVTQSAVRDAGEFFRLDFSDGWLYYEAWVDRRTGEVPGLTCQPLMGP